MLKGIGDCFARTKNLVGGATAQRICNLYLSEFEYTVETEQLQALAYATDGIRKIKRSASGTETNTFTLRMQFMDWSRLGFSLGKFDRTATSATVPLLKYATVPSSAPYEIVDAAVTAGNSSGISVFFDEFRSPTNQAGFAPRAATPASPASGEVGVDTTGTKLVFNVAQAGMSVVYTIPQTLSNKKVYGGQGTSTAYGEIEFFGQVFVTDGTQPWDIWFPSLTQTSKPSFSFAGDVPQIEITYTANLLSGWDEPFQILNSDT